MMRSGAFAFLGLFDTPFVCAVGLEAGLAGDDRADRRAVMCPSLRRCSTLAHAVRQQCAKVELTACVYFPYAGEIPLSLSLALEA